MGLDLTNCHLEYGYPISFCIFIPYTMEIELQINMDCRPYWVLLSKYIFIENANDMHSSNPNSTDFSISLGEIHHLNESFPIMFSGMINQMFSLFKDMCHCIRRSYNFHKKESIFHFLDMISMRNEQKTSNNTSYIMIQYKKKYFVLSTIVYPKCQCESKKQLQRERKGRKVQKASHFLQHGEFFMNALLDHMFVMLLSWWNSPQLSVVLALTYNIQWVPNKDWLIGTEILM